MCGSYQTDVTPISVDAHTFQDCVDYIDVYFDWAYIDFNFETGECLSYHATDAVTPVAGNHAIALRSNCPKDTGAGCDPQPTVTWDLIGNEAMSRRSFYYLRSVSWDLDEVVSEWRGLLYLVMYSSNEIDDEIENQGNRTHLLAFLCLVFL